MKSIAVIAATTDWTTTEWDAIVVGAGTAGIIVADRLSEAGMSTLLLELGGVSYGVTGGRERPDWLQGTDLSRVDVPGLYKSIFSGGSPLLCPSDVVSAFQACTIGGNSAINAGLYFQPPADDWDSYFPEGWHSKDVQPAISRLLARQPAVTAYSQDNKYYLQSGYNAAREWLVGAAGFTNVSMSAEPNKKDRVFGRPVYNYIGGQRGGPTRTYLQSALKRSNFHLQTGARVKHIIQNKGTASGVVVTVNGKDTTVKIKANGKVVLSAGAILSPKILMYSGIGPADVLNKLAQASHTPYTSKSWVVNSAVGNGLFDNPNTFIELSSPSVQAYTQSYSNPVPQDRDLFLSKRSGPYTFASQTSVFWGYVPHSDGTKTGVQGTIDSSGYSGFTNGNTITLNVYGTSGLLSAGRVVLSDDGKFTAGPSSDVYYTHERDAKDIATFIHSIFQALPKSTPQSPAKNGLTPLNIPQSSTVAEIQKYITTPSAYAVGQVQHWSSSCRIGSCVDKDTKVIGTKNIHVIDASILSPLTVNPQFGVMVAAEKGTERILASRAQIKASINISI
ncbi:cellobiose dehydrogenase [Stachybotrys elegans]|uniref:Cellobiose dehydrogenase n=1 Tax=Stachybotrys elegans TaxID=80388 RepID=A0A8K0WTU8_9HYPO|nr:cellobiose dehydrogenase [Stachybotrys elegans]